MTAPYSYHDWLESKAHRSGTGEPMEPATANPDVLPEVVKPVSRWDNAIRGLMADGNLRRRMFGQDNKVFTMVFLRGKSYSEVARILGGSKSRITFAVQRIREKVLEYLSESGEPYELKKC